MEREEPYFVHICPYCGYQINEIAYNLLRYDFGCPRKTCGMPLENYYLKEIKGALNERN